MLLIGSEGKKLLIDCGTDIRFSLHKAGFSHLDLTDIYISNLHADHAGGLEYIAFSTKFDPRCSKPTLYLTPDIASELWSNTLSGGMRSLEGEIADLETFFNVHKIEENSYFYWDNIQFKPIRVIYVNNGCFLMPSYGLFFEIEGTKIFITTDSQFNLELLENCYKEADIIFQDCEVSDFPSKIHAHYKELLKLPERIKNKMWLYHYQPVGLPNATQDGFQGFVKRGQIFEFSPSLSLTPLNA